MSKKASKKKSGGKKSVPGKSARSKSKGSKSASNDAKKTEVPEKTSEKTSMKTSDLSLSMKDLVAYNYSGIPDKRVKFKKEFSKQARQYAKQGLWLIDLAEKFKVHRTTIDAWRDKYPTFNDSILGGASEFIGALGPKLVRHSEEGRSFESFAYVCGRSKSFLYGLLRIDPVFKEYADRAYVGSLYRWEELAQAQAQGSLRKVTSEKIVLDKNGTPMRDPLTGEILKDRTFASTMGSDRSLIFSMQNRFEEYKPDKSGDESELFNELKEVMEHVEAQEMKKRQVTANKKNSNKR